MLLTKRELEIVSTLSETLSDNRSIGIILGLTERSIKNHLTKIYNKVGVMNRHQLIQWYYKNVMKERI